MSTIISKDEFLRACQQKVANDKRLADERKRKEEEERRRIEEERKRKEEEERQRKADEARRKAEEERKRKENADWDNWYANLPSTCKSGFVLGNFQYNVNKNSRTITKTPLLGDPRGRFNDREFINPKDVRDLRFSGDAYAGIINEELGI